MAVRPAATVDGPMNMSSMASTRSAGRAGAAVVAGTVVEGLFWASGFAASLAHAARASANAATTSVARSGVLDIGGCSFWWGSPTVRSRDFRTVSVDGCGGRGPCDVRLGRRIAGI